MSIIKIENFVVDVGHTSAILTVFETADIPTIRTADTWLLDLQAKVLYFDNGTTLVSILSTSSSGTVTSVFGRPGPAITAEAGDYAAFYATLAEIAGFVPYNGATNDVHLGNFSLFAELLESSDISIESFGSAFTIVQSAVAGVAGGNKTIVWRDLSGTPALLSDLAILAPKASPALTGNPTAPTQALGDISTDIATDQFVQNALDDYNFIALTNNIAVYFPNVSTATSIFTFGSPAGVTTMYELVVDLLIVSTTATTLNINVSYVDQDGTTISVNLLGAVSNGGTGTLTRILSSVGTYYIMPFIFRVQASSPIVVTTVFAAGSIMNYRIGATMTDLKNPF